MVTTIIPFTIMKSYTKYTKEKVKKERSGEKYKQMNNAIYREQHCALIHHCGLGLIRSVGGNYILI